MDVEVGKTQEAPSTEATEAAKSSTNSAVERSDKPNVVEDPIERRTRTSAENPIFPSLSQGQLVETTGIPLTSGSGASVDSDSLVLPASASAEKKNRKKSVSQRVHKLSDTAYTKLFGENYSRREATFVILAGGLIALNMGFVNGALLSGFLFPNGETQSVSGYSSSFTRSGLSTIKGDWDRFGYFSSLILSYMMGAFIAGVMNPRATPYQLEPSYGPTFMIGGAFMIIAAFLSAFQVGKPDYVFFLCAAANGIQNGIASIYSKGLIRCSLTGSATDIAINLGEMLRGNYARVSKASVLAVIIVNFWFGGFLSYHFVRRFESYTLLFNAAMFMLIGASLAWFLVVEIGVSAQAALLGNWKWKKLLKKINSSFDLGEETKEGLTEVALLELFDHMDNDGSGSIDAEELVDVLTGAGIKLTAFEIRTLFRAADKNYDGVISREEWQELVTKICKSSDSAEVKV